MESQRQYRESRILMAISLRFIEEARMFTCILVMMMCALVVVRLKSKMKDYQILGPLTHVSSTLGPGSVKFFFLKKKKIEVIGKRKNNGRRFIEMIAMVRMVFQKVKKGLKHKVKISGERGSPWKTP